MCLRERFADDGKSVYVGRQWSERENLEWCGTFAIIVAAVGINIGDVATVDRYAIVVDI